MHQIQWPRMWDSTICHPQPSNQVSSWAATTGTISRPIPLVKRSKHWNCFAKLFQWKYPITQSITQLLNAAGPSCWSFLPCLFSTIGEYMLLYDTNNQDPTRIHILFWLSEMVIILTCTREHQRALCVRPNSPPLGTPQAESEQSCGHIHKKQR